MAASLARLARHAREALAVSMSEVLSSTALAARASPPPRRVHCSAPGRGADGLRRRPSRSDGHAPPSPPLNPRCRPVFPSGRASLIGHHCAGSNALRRHRARLRGRVLETTLKTREDVRSPTCLLAARPACSPLVMTGLTRNRPFQHQKKRRTLLCLSYMY